MGDSLAPKQLCGIWHHYLACILMPYNARAYSWHLHKCSPLICNAAGGVPAYKCQAMRLCALGTLWIRYERVRYAFKEATRIHV